MRAVCLAFVLTLAASTPLLAQTKPSTAPIIVHLNLDLSVDIEEKHCIGDAAIKTKLEELRERRPSPELRMVVDGTVPYYAVAHLFGIAQRVGGLKFGFVGISQ